MRPKVFNTILAKVEDTPHEEVVNTVVRLVDVWAANARPYERMGEWIERITWPRFFQMAELPFTKEHIDDFKHAGLSYNRTAQLTHVSS